MHGSIPITFSFLKFLIKAPSLLPISNINFGLNFFLISLESFLKDRRYQEVRDSISNYKEIRNNLALVFREIISLGLVTTQETDEEEIETRKLEIDKRKLEIRKILTETPGVRGRKKTKKKTKKKKRNLSK